MKNLIIGNKGEDLACEYLKSRGYKILDRNFRIRGGEIDIIAQDRDVIAFVEVKARYSHEYGLPVEAMTFWKIKALLRAVQFYLVKHGLGKSAYRLDFVGIDFTNSRDNPKIELIKNITG